MSESATTSYQLRVVLRHVPPMVWRRVLVRSATSIAQLHHIIHGTLGWEAVHLHRFRRHGRDSGTAIGSLCSADRHAVTLASFRLRPRERFAYLYDVHAWWQPAIRREQSVAAVAHRQSPICIGGTHACPPEDCSGPDDYRRRVQERMARAALDDRALVADFVRRWRNDQVRGTDDEQVKVSTALERMAARQRRDPDQFDRRAVNAARAHVRRADDRA